MMLLQPKLLALISWHFVPPRIKTVSLSFQEVQLSPDSPALRCKTSTGHPRPFLPQSLSRDAFMQLHQLAHLGIRGSQALIGEHFFWLHMRRDTAHWTRECLACQASKVQCHVRSPLQHVPVPAESFTHIHVDIVGPLPPSRCHSYLLIIVDQTSRWPETLPMTSISAEECARTFTLGWVARFGVPLDITSDRRRQFTSAIGITSPPLSAPRYIA